jgi:MFS family permease
VRVVVFGQDPYPRPGHADGLAFSAGHGKPVSLRRIFEILKADRPGWQRPLILAGYAIATLVRPFIAVAGSAWQVVAARVTDRVGKGLRSPARDALIAEVTPVEARGRAFGFQRGADHLGAVAGSLAAWFLLSRGFDVRSVIAVGVVPGAFAMSRADAGPASATHRLIVSSTAAECSSRPADPSIRRVLGSDQRHDLPAGGGDFETLLLLRLRIWAWP